jgi:thioredoxin reductase (NADPH)
MDAITPISPTPAKKTVQKYDVVVIGAGPAGLAAAIYAARGGLRTIIFEKALVGGQITMTAEIENYPGFPEVQSGFELVEKMEKQARRFQAEFRDEEIIALGLDGLCKVLETTESLYRAKAVIFATGAHSRRLNTPGEERLTGRGVSYCATCDGALYRDKTVAVIGGGDSAVEEAMFLTRFARKVYIVHRRDQLRAVWTIQQRARNNSKIEFVLDSIVQEIVGDEKVEGILTFNRKTEQSRLISVDGVFIYVGILPNSALLESRVNLDPQGFVLTDDAMHTNVPGLFAAGDIVHKILRQVVTAVSDGAVAAFSAEKWIAENQDKLIETK